MSLADRCSYEFGGQIQGRGKQYFREGRVHLGSVAGKTVEATVRGRSGDYVVLLDWSEAGDGYIEASCTCPYYEGGALCKHIWATMLAADARGIATPAGKRKLSVLAADGEDEEDDYWDDDPDDEDPDDWDDDAYDDGPYPSSNGRPWQPSGPTPQSASPVGSSNSRRSLPALASRTTALRRFPNSVRPAKPGTCSNVGASLEANALVILLFQRETKLSGEFGKLKTLSIDRRSVDRFPRPDDREILQLLLINSHEPDEASGPYRNRYGYYGYYGYEPKISEVALAAGAYEQVLPKLCATGRLLWTLDGSQEAPEADGRRWPGTVARPGGFVCASSRTTRETLAAGWPIGPRRGRSGSSLENAGVGARRRSDALERPPGAVGGRRYFGLDRGPSPLPSIAVPYQDRWELLERLWQLPSQPEASLPANLACQTSHFSPQGRLIVHSPQRYGRNRLYADVEFHYDGKKVRAADPAVGMVDREHERVLVRDREKEREMLGMLVVQGMRAADARRFQGHDLWLPPKRLAALVEALVPAGWIVEAEGLRIRKPGQWRLSVTSGIDWFDLEGTCEFDGVTAKLPELLEALRHGEKYVRLGDGSRGLVPQEWLDKFAALANLGEAEGDCVRFRPSQALLLDALLAAQKDVAVDRQFAHVRRKLRSFRGRLAAR